MKTIYINDSAKKVIEEGILMDTLPDVVTSTIGDISLPNIFEEGFLENLIQERFEETKGELHSIGQINDVPDNKIENVLAKLIQMCQEEERPYRNALEKLCLNYLVDFFAIPDDMIQLKLSLSDEIKIDNNIVLLDPVTDSDESFDIESLDDEVRKRRMLNVLAMGAGMQVSSNIKSYIADVYEINPKLPDLYRKILALNNYLLFTRDFNITDENNMQLGTVLVSLQNQENHVKIFAQGKIFPVLLSESIRGFVELFGSHGLPKGRENVEYVMERADYLKAEPWDMRIGPSLWTMLTDSFIDVDSDLIPYLYKTIAMLPIRSFNLILSEIFKNTERGKRLMGKVIGQAKYEKEYDNFEDQMSHLKVDKSLLSDEINPDEL